MKKLYSYLLAGLAVLMVSGLSAQVTGITVTNTAPCPGETVTVAWNAGSDGGTPFTVTVSTVAYGGVDVFGPSLFFANTVDIPVADGETYYVTVEGGSGTGATNVPLIVTQDAPTAPTGFTVNTAAVSKVCSGIGYNLDATGQDLGSNGVVRWYLNDETTLVGTGTYAAPSIATEGASITYKVRVEDAVCSINTAFFPVTVTSYNNASAAATGVDFNGGASPVCPGTVTFAQTGAVLGDNPATTVKYYSDAGFTTEYIGATTTLASGANADVYVQVVDACSAVAYNSGPFNVVAKTTSTAPTSVSVSNAGPVCPTTSVTYTSVGGINGTGVSYLYQVNGAGLWIADADGVVTLGITTTTSVAFKKIDDCNVVGTAGVSSVSVSVYTLSTDITAVTHTAGTDNEICSGGSVTFDGNGVLGNEPTSVFEFQVTENGVITTPWATTINPIAATHTMNVVDPTGTVVEFRVNDGCTGLGAEVASATITLAANNVAPTTLTPTPGATTCGDEDITFTTDGTLGGNGALFQFAAEPAFTTILQSSASNSYVHSVTSDVTMYVRILGGCNDVSGVTPSAAVDHVLANVAPTSLLADADTVCPGTSVTFTVDGATLGLGATYDFDTDPTFASIDANNTTGIHTTVISANTTMYARINGGCNPIVTVVDSVIVTKEVTAAITDILLDNVSATSLTTCGDSVVTVTADLVGAGSLSAGSTLEYSFDNFGTTTSITSLSFPVNITSDATLKMRINDACDPALLADVKTVTFTHNVSATNDISIVSSENFDFCIPAAVTPKTFTANIGTIGTGGQLQYSTDNTNWFNTDDATNSSAFTIADITSVTNIYVRLSLACNAGLITVVDSTVNVSIQVTGDADISSTHTLLAGNVACDDQTGNFIFDTNNNVDVTGTSGTWEYVFTGPSTVLDWNNATSGTAESIIGFTIDADTTLNVRLVDCFGVVSTAAPFVIDYKEPTDVSSIIVKSEYGDDVNALTLIPVLPGKICIGDDAYVSLSSYTLGDGASVQYSIDGGTSWLALVMDTVKLLDIQVTTTVDFQVIGSCNAVVIQSSTVNVYDALPEVTSLTIDKDNLCANDGETIRLTAFTTVPVATPYVYEWSKYKASNNTYTKIVTAPNTAIYDVTPDTITAYSVRIIGCNDTSAYVTRLITIKDTSNISTATIVTSADANGSKVCAGTTVTYNLVGGKKGFDAILFWFDNHGNALGQGNPFTMTVSQDTTVQAMYVGECNTTVLSVAKQVQVYEQSDVTVTFDAGDKFCVGSTLVLADTVTGNPLGGVFSGANITGGVMSVQAGVNPFVYTFNFGGCSFSVNDTAYGIAAPNAALVAGSIVNDACSAFPVGEFKVEDIDNEGLTFKLYLGASLLSTKVSMNTVSDSIVTFDMLAAGAYSVVASNATGCVDTVKVIITSPAGLTAKIDTANSALLVCNDATNGKIVLVATGGVAPYEFTFDNGLSNFSSKNDTTGLDGNEIFDLKVKDASGCIYNIGDDAQIVKNTNVVSLTLLNIVEPTCYDALDGRFDAVASGGIAPYKYSIDGVNFQTESRFDGLDVDVYTVTVTNSLGCPRNFISPLLGPDSLSVVQSIVSGDPINGYEVLFTISGGNGGFEIAINGGTFGTTFQLSQTSGDYTYVVRDVNGCTKSGSYKLDGVNGVNNINDVVSSVYPNPFTSTLTLVGADMNNAEVIFTDINGKVLSVEMETSNDKVVISTSDVANGIYLVKVVTNNGSTVKRVIKN